MEEATGIKSQQPQQQHLSRRIEEHLYHHPPSSHPASFISRQGDVVPRSWRKVGLTTVGCSTGSWKMAGCWATETHCCGPWRSSGLLSGPRSDASQSIERDACKEPTFQRANQNRRSLPLENQGNWCGFMSAVVEVIAIAGTPRSALNCPRRGSCIQRYEAQRSNR